MTTADEQQTTAKKAKTYKVGDRITVRPSGIVTRPDGSTHIVIKGTFYLDQAGTFLVDGDEVTVK